MKMLVNISFQGVENLSRDFWYTKVDVQKQK